MDEGCKGEIIQGQTVTKDDGSSGFWSSSTFEKDHSEARSRGSVSSSGITMSISSDFQSSSSSQISPPEPVNQGMFMLFSLFPILKILHDSLRKQLIAYANTDLNDFHLVYAGLVLWNQIRQQWAGNKRLESQTEAKEPQIR